MTHVGTSSDVARSSPDVMLRRAFSQLCAGIFANYMSYSINITERETPAEWP